MRTLLAKDIAPFTKILSKMELKESLKGMFEKSEKGNGEMISELIWGITENYYKAEKEFFAFLADLDGKTIDEISELPLPDFINLLTEIFNNKNLPFFKFAAK
jgi:hypothetical protein